MKRPIISATVLALTLTASPAFASGSGGGGGYGGSGSYSAPRISPAERLERRGKSQLRKRITCKKCEYHKRLNNQTAPEIAQGVRNGKFKLRQKDREAVLFYLRSRYSI